MPSTFSGRSRTHILEQMEEQVLDVLVIGGGVTGAGIALDASVRGMKTGLIDMQDFAAGTSSRSTKLVHGGLRYLKQFEIKLVAEVGKERAIVYENAPHVTTPVWMLLPIYQNGTFGALTTSLGLMVYDFLAGVRRHERRKMLSRNAALQAEPLLAEKGLKGAGLYVEYRTDDARLTLEIMKAAVSHGALAVNYVRAQEFIYDNGKVAGIIVIDEITGAVKKLYAHKIVNAAGPWVDTLREMDNSKKGKYLHLTKGVHIVIDQSKFPLRQAVYFDTPNKDGRMIFAIPRNGKAYVGTTDTHYQGDPADAALTVQDLDYLLNAVNAMFPEVKLSEQDVESSWAGIGPLIHEEGKGPSEISRKDEIFISPSGLITIAGGKLTGYRKMAERVVDLAAQQLQAEGGGSYPRCSTEIVRLSGGLADGSKRFAEFVRDKVTAGQALGLSAEQAERLTRLYGANIDSLYELIRESRESSHDVLAYGLPLDVWASLMYGVQHEMVVTPSDYFIRRTGAIWFGIAEVHKWKAQVIEFLSAYYKWSEEEKNSFVQELDEQIRIASVPQTNLV